MSNTKYTHDACIHTLRDRLDAERASNLANTKELHRADAEIGRLRQSNADLLAALEHAMACDMPDEIDFRCAGCEAARAAIRKARGDK